MNQSGGYYYHQQQQKYDRSREIMSINNLLVPSRNGSINNSNNYQMPAGQSSRNLQPGPSSRASTPHGSTHITSPNSSDNGFERTPREKREPYSDQAQFYIMFVRVGREKDWNEIERSFEEVFGQHRAKDGLTAVYYRIRHKWGLRPVNKCSQEMSEEGKCMIRQRSRGFDQAFLRRVGFFEWCQSGQSTASAR